MFKALISGYYGFGNCGDEAMLFAIVTQLKKRIPDLHVVVLSQRPEDTAREFGVQAVPRRDFRLIWKELRTADLLLSGGGSLFQDVTSPRNVFYYAAIILMAKVLGKKICIYGQGIGPLNYRFSKYLVGRVVGWADVVTLRDEGSRRELTSLGIAKPAYVTADPVLGLDTKLADLERGRAILAAAGIKEGLKNHLTEAPGRPALIGISLRQWPNLTRFLPVVAKVADRVAAEGNKVVFVPLQPGDLPVLNLVREQMERPAIIVENIKGFRDLMSVMVHLDLCIGMRLHFLIFAAMFSVPAVGLGYDPKVPRFMNQVGLPAVPMTEVTEEVLMRFIQDLFEHMGTTREKLKKRVRELRARAETNADLVADLLKRGDLGV